MENTEIVESKTGTVALQLNSTTNLLDTLPESFQAFLREKGIPLENFTLVPPRYFRLKPTVNVSLEQLAKDIGVDLADLDRFNDFYRLPAEQSIHHCNYYSTGKLYGMDMSSGYAVKALDLKDDMDLLELCCAPGNKLMYARDLMNGGTITGVDISQPRMEITRSLIKKYGHEQSIQLYCEDATKFDRPPSKDKLYDRVLVDAQCTHEGSLKHLKKFLNTMKEPSNEPNKPSRSARKQFRKNNSNPYTSSINNKNLWTKEDFEERFLDKKKLEMLHELQTALIENGYQMTKHGGRLVYSTCSFDSNQNERIVEALLQRHPECQMVEPFPEESRVHWEKSDLKFAVRFTPKVSNTGGLFIAAIVKH